MGDKTLNTPNLPSIAVRGISRLMGGESSGGSSSADDIRALYDWAARLVNALTYELSNITAGAVYSSTYIQPGIIGSTEIEDLSVTTGKIALLAVDTAQLANLAITTGKIADANVSTDKLASLAVTASKLAGATEGSQINVSSIVNGHCATTNTQGLVNGDHVRFGSGGTTSGGYYLVSDLVVNTSFHIDDATITDPTAVSCYEATEGAITYEKIANLAVGHTAIAAAAIGTAHIANAAITTALIGDLQVVSAKILDCAVNKLTSGSITSKQISMAITEGAGDSYISWGKSDFGQSTTQGIIIGFDDSAANSFKMELYGASGHSMVWDGSSLTIRGTLNASDISAGTMAVSYLAAGTITSKTIAMAIGAGTGDSILTWGKTDFGQTTTAGIIIGYDDSDSDKFKLEMYGAVGNSLVWDGSTLTVRGSLNADDISAGTITGRTLQTASSGKRFVVSIADNQAHFYGDRGDGTVEQLIDMGISGGNACIEMGTGLSGAYLMLRNGIVVETAYDGVKASTWGSNRYGVHGYAYAAGGVGVYGFSDELTGYGVYGYNTVGNAVAGSGRTGVYANCSNVSGDRDGYSIWTVFASEAYWRGPIRLAPSASASAPSHTGDVGALWVTSAGVLYINTDGGTTWAKVGAQ